MTALRFRTSLLACLAFLALCALTSAEEKGKGTDSPPTHFAVEVAPFLEKYCTACHGGEEPEAKLALDTYSDSANIQQDFGIWERTLRMLRAQQMPPADVDQPSQEEYAHIIKAIEAELDRYDCTSERHPGRVTLRRLNRVEYNNTIRDLVGIDFQPADDFPADDVGNGFDNIGDVLSMPPILMEKYLNAADEVIEKAFADKELRNRILAHKTEDSDERREVMQKNIRAFAARAFRRPVRDEEINALYELRRKGSDLGLTDREIDKIPFKAILASPYFLFRVEQDPAEDDEDGIRELGDYELATRLSYFLWSTMPDEELFQLAEKGELHKPEVLKAQALRMLKDAKSRALVENFAGQWLQLRDVMKLNPDPEMYPDFDEQLRRAMLKETQLFLSTLIEEDRRVLDVLSADFTFVNERLARHYGMEGIEGDEFRRVPLGERRRGVLTQASILMLTSNPTRTSPVKRGKWILENILGEPPPPPPAAVPPLEEQELLGTLRERMEQHRANPACAVCHKQMDTLGFGLENFDGIGAWRDRDGRFKINPSGTLPGGVEFDSASELMQILAQQRRDQFCRCLTEKMLTYALGRGLVPFDRCAVKEITSGLKAQDYRFSALVTGIVTSEPFRFRERAGE